jgi:thioredoxin reductase (NADPH)
MKDCIIIGGGPAGLTAALYLARFLRDVVVFDAREGRALKIPKTHNLSPFPDGISGRNLLSRMRSHAEIYGAELVDDTVLKVCQADDAFHVTPGNGTTAARTVILASGVVNHGPPLSVQDHDLGLSRGLIRYCPICDAYEVRGKKIGVLGHGEHGLAEARFIRSYSDDVKLIPPKGFVPHASADIETLASPMLRLLVTDTQVLVEVESGEQHPFDTLYVALGTSPRSDLAVSIRAKCSPSGCVVVDAQQKTSIKGVYAIGDIDEGLDQIAFAMGQGAVAATAIHHSLRA